jgi:ATP-binding cassette subfamily C protein CydD
LKLDPRILNAAHDQRAGLMITMILGALQGICIVLQALLLSQIVDAVFLHTASLSTQSTPLLILIMLSFLRFVLRLLQKVTGQRNASIVKGRLRGRLLQQLFALGPSFLANQQKGELSNTLTEGVEALEAYIRDYVPQLALAALIPITILVFVFANDLTSGIVLLLTAPLIPLFMVLIGDRAEHLTQRQWFSMSRMSALFLETLQGLPTIKLLGQAHNHTLRLASLSEQYRKTTLEVMRVAFLSALVLEWLATLGTAVIAVEIGLRLLAGRLSFQPAFFILLLAPEFYLPLRRLGLHFHAGMSGIGAADRIFGLLDEKHQLITSAHHGLNRCSCLTVQHLTFTYPDRARPALDDISLNLEVGKLTTIIGPSGSGKSTLGACLLGFLLPESGIVSCDHQVIEQQKTIRHLIAWVPQTPRLFHGSIEANLRVANQRASYDQLQTAAQSAQILDFILSLPQGFKTLIGEQGFRLSAGQVQRLALARALLKPAPILILDEATAHLDSITEKAIFDHLVTRRQNQALLVLTHRLGITTIADEILLVVAGKVLERGSHQELLGHNGYYRSWINSVGRFVT